MPQPTQITQQANAAIEDTGPDNVDALVGSLPGPGAQQPVQTTSTATPAPVLTPAADPIVEFAKSLGYAADDGEFTRDDFVVELERRYKQSELAAKHFGDDFNEERLQRALLAEQRTAQAEQQPPTQQTQQAQQQAQDEDTILAAFAKVPEPDAKLYEYATRDAQSGRWVPRIATVPDCVDAAKELNKFDMTIADRFRRIGVDPITLIERVVDRKVAAFSGKVDEIVNWRQQQSAADLEQAELNKLQAAHPDLFSDQMAIDAFNKAYQIALNGKATFEAARELGMEFVRATVAIPTTQTTGALPQRQPPQNRPPGSGRKVIARQPRATDVTGGGAGSAALPMTDRPEPESIDAMVEMAGQLATAQLGR